MTSYLHEHVETLVKGKTVLELGAASGLPSLAAAVWGAGKVVMTDYPDEELVACMRKNVEEARRYMPEEGSGGGIVVALVSLPGSL